MLTRSMDSHRYYPSPYSTTLYQGAIRQTTVNGIPTTWAVARPVASPRSPVIGPSSFQYGSGLSFSPAQPNVEMDPSNQQTWQRPYRFTT